MCIRDRDADVPEQFRADLVLTALAAGRLHVHGSKPMTEREEGVKLVVFVVGMRGRLQERPDDVQAPEREAESHVSVFLGHERDHPGLSAKPGVARGEEDEGQDTDGNRKDRQSFHSDSLLEVEREANLELALLEVAVRNERIISHFAADRGSWRARTAGAGAKRERTGSARDVRCLSSSPRIASHRARFASLSAERTLPKSCASPSSAVMRMTG